MARRKKSSSVSFGRIAALAGLLALAAIGWWGWQHRAQWRFAGEPRSGTSSVPAPDAVQQLSGELQIVKPPRDKDLGIAAPGAIALLRDVAMLQWHEQCAGDRCRYELAWTAQHVDSRKFRNPAGHENPPAPFAEARFVAQQIRLGDVDIAQELINFDRIAAQHAPLEYPVKIDALPANLAASFSIADGALYAGGDPAHPQPGTLRIRYRILPAGEVTLSGVRRGNRFEAR